MHCTVEVSAVEVMMSAGQPHLEKIAKRALQQSGYRHVELLECDVIDKVAVLTGEVPSFYLKQIAQEAILRLGDFHTVENRVQVQEA